MHADSLQSLSPINVDTPTREKIIANRVKRFEAQRQSTLESLPFAEAAVQWLETRKPYISAKSYHEYELNIKTLSRTFGVFRLTEIDADMIRKYQRIRLTQCGPSAINHECSVVQQMLKRIGRWNEVERNYQPLPLPKWQPGRVISETEKARLIRLASTDPNWEAAYLFAALSVNTTAGPKEVATLRE